MFIACDVSGKEKTDRYLTLGSVWLPKKQLSQYMKAVCSFRLDNRLWGELKWVKINNQKLKEYKDFLTLGLGNFPFEFKIIIRDKKIQIPRGRFRNKKELFSTFYYELLSNHARRILRRRQRIISFEILIDKGEMRDQILTLKNFIEYSFRKEGLGQELYICQCDSKICPAIQLCDLVVGATSTKINRSWSRISKSKKEIIKHIENLVAHKLDIPTLPGAIKFNLWLWKPSASP